MKVGAGVTELEINAIMGIGVAFKRKSVLSS